MWRGDFVREPPGGAYEKITQNKSALTLVPSTPVVARRRMTTPVVAPRSGFYPPTSNLLVPSLLSM